jgi:hypothetical protein
LYSSSRRRATLDAQAGELRSEVGGDPAAHDETDQGSLMGTYCMRASPAFTIGITIGSTCDGATRCKAPRQRLAFMAALATCSLCRERGGRNDGQESPHYYDDVKRRRLPGPSASGCSTVSTSSPRFLGWAATRTHQLSADQAPTVNRACDHLAGPRLRRDPLHFDGITHTLPSKSNGNA